MTLHRSATLLFVLVCACDGGKSGDGLTVSDLVVGGCGDEELRPSAPSPEGLSPDSGDTAGPETLTVTASGAGTVQVLHQNVPDECCVEHEVATSISGTTLTIEYPSSGDPCDCMCSYDYSFTVSGLTAGEWTVEAGDASAVVTVE